jgi:hypothetical protein
MIILSFDIGILHLGVCVLELDETTWLTSEKLPIRVLHVDLIDITRYTHNVVSQENCMLYHSNDIGDRLYHALQEHEPQWGSVNMVLLEMQPICGGLTNVEALLSQRYRDKVHKVSPNSMHRRFRLSDDYDKRKIQVVQLATPWLKVFPKFVEVERKHDIADAFVIAVHQILEWNFYMGNKRSSNSL